MSELENQFGSLMDEIETTSLLPVKGLRGQVLPALRGDLRIDVREHDNEVMVVADLPGVEKEDITVNLLNARTLQITCERKTEQEEKSEGYYMRERRFGSTSRLVRLPVDVKDNEYTGSFKNGVLEVRLKKSLEEKGKIIPIE
jgi:HSP20 family protein